MTINFKSGQHPDADQLSAFIEQALPAHERESVLAHLAVCGECRGVVALALPEVSAFEPAAPAPERRRWFAGWMVLVPTAAAVAALAVFIVLVHHRAPAPQQQAQLTPAQIAPPAPQPQPQAAPSVRNEKTPAPKPRQDAPRAVMGVMAGSSAGAPGSVLGNVSPGQSFVQRQVQQPPANEFNQFAPREKGFFSGRMKPTEQNSTQQNEVHGELQAPTMSADKLAQPRVSQGLDQQKNNYQNANQRSETQTVSVEAAPVPIETESAAIDSAIAGRAVAQLSLSRQPLPSGRAILSTAAQGTMVLAIDTHHGVFVSSDSGNHWQPVRAVWKGRAVQVEAIAVPKSVVIPAVNRSVTSFAALQSGAMAAKTASATLSGTVTDTTGAVIPGATVTITESATNLSHTLTTDATGRFTAAGLQPGTYNLDAMARGFKNYRQTNVAVSAANENVVNVTLDIGAAAETVTVESSANTLQTTDAELSATPLKKMKNAPKAAPPPRPVPAPAVTPVFEIVTDKGVRWTSADGVAWRPE
ncbi:MAG TPA: carboxypeptidase regulatory-like domain-containing protein [Terracidiphilus sp.]|nr:carboxypeptidase regulatory-like domain-containing protein [Terracidiphilus sp.]